MGVCLSCLGMRQGAPTDAERQRLLYEDPYAPSHGGNYGSWSQAPPVPSQNLMSPEELRREQQALNSITRWASDQIVEIFPHRTALANVALGGAASHVNGHGGTDSGSNSDSGTNNGAMSATAHQDILLSMIPGDKSKRLIRIYPASRPGSSLSQNESIRSKGSAARTNGTTTLDSKAKGVFVKLNVEL